MEAIHDGATQRLQPSLVYDVETAIVQHPQSAQLDDAQLVRVRLRAAHRLGRRTLPTPTNAQFAVVVGVVLMLLMAVSVYRFGLGSPSAALFAILGSPALVMAVHDRVRGAK